MHIQNEKQPKENRNTEQTLYIANHPPIHWIVIPLLKIIKSHADENQVSIVANDRFKSIFEKLGIKGIFLPLREDDYNQSSFLARIKQRIFKTLTSQPTEGITKRTDLVNTIHSTLQTGSIILFPTGSSDTLKPWKKGVGSVIKQLAQEGATTRIVFVHIDHQLKHIIRMIFKPPMQVTFDSVFDLLDEIGIDTLKLETMTDQEIAERLELLFKNKYSK